MRSFLPSFTNFRNFMRNIALSGICCGDDIESMNSRDYAAIFPDRMDREFVLLMLINEEEMDQRHRAISDERDDNRASRSTGTAPDI